MSKPIVERLREYTPTVNDASEAADHIERLTAELAAAKERAEHAETELKNAARLVETKKVKKLIQKIESLERRLGAAEKSNAGYVAEIRSATTNAAKLEAELAAERERADNAQRGENHLFNRVKELRAENAKLREALERVRTMVDQMPRYDAVLDTRIRKVIAAIDAVLKETAS